MWRYNVYVYARQWPEPRAVIYCGHWPVLRVSRSLHARLSKTRVLLLLLVLLPPVYSISDAAFPWPASGCTAHSVLAAPSVRPFRSRSSENRQQHLTFTLLYTMCSRHYSGLWTLLALIVAVAVAAPPQAPAAESQQTPQQPDLTADDVVLYDQRQNGTENVRISLSDLKVVLAPADGLFQIMSMAGAQFLNSELTSPSKLQHRPTSDTECTGFKCNNRHRQTAKTSVYINRHT